jgi:hypothetical protein
VRKGLTEDGLKGAAQKDMPVARARYHTYARQSPDIAC